jgi:hypothetical protein
MVNFRLQGGGNNKDPESKSPGPVNKNKYDRNGGSTIKRPYHNAVSIAKLCLTFRSH